ncbi:phosphotransferase family protein [Mycolicibacterium sp. ELW1]|uniref:phosphotransferase family protein n=1 Tax=Mycobacteriaceae TaxID=1762 RepID=UPI0011EE1947|nr:phosphotransferase family protein [Mycobacterium sp. ELW1]QEN17057.1 phosphotransferase family protein [Mycobacterium sp. ELW1]
MATGDERWARPTATLIAGGKSNLTFELTCTAGNLILRRPPRGDLLPSAHDMVREARVQRALADSEVPVASIVLVDLEGSLLGTPCYVMSKVDGYVIRDAMPDGYVETADDCRGIGDALIDTLIAIHAVDPTAVGLTDFGRPEGFLYRQIRRWSDQWSRTAIANSDEMVMLAHLLVEKMPPATKSTIVHGDFRLDNCVMDKRDPHRVAAVLDWELSTVGDPLTDLGMFLFYWREPGECQHTLVPSVATQPGFPSRRYLAQRYSEQTGVSLESIDYYLAFANFKFACIVQGIAARVTAGSMAGQDFGGLEASVADFARTGLAILDSAAASRG